MAGLVFNLKSQITTHKIHPLPPPVPHVIPIHAGFSTISEHFSHPRPVSDFLRIPRHPRLIRGKVCSFLRALRGR